MTSIEKVEKTFKKFGEYRTKPQWEMRANEAQLSTPIEPKSDYVLDV
jgi:hypothetical protein